MRLSSTSWKSFSSEAKFTWPTFKTFWFLISLNLKEPLEADFKKKHKEAQHAKLVKKSFFFFYFNKSKPKNRKPNISGTACVAVCFKKYISGGKIVIAVITSIPRMMTYWTDLYLIKNLIMYKKTNWNIKSKIFCYH